MTYLIQIQETEEQHRQGLWQDYKRSKDDRVIIRIMKDDETLKDAYCHRLLTLQDKND